MTFGSAWRRFLHVHVESEPVQVFRDERADRALTRSPRNEDGVD